MPVPPMALPPTALRRWAKPPAKGPEFERSEALPTSPEKSSI